VNKGGRFNEGRFNETRLNEGGRLNETRFNETRFNGRFNEGKRINEGRFNEGKRINEGRFNEGKRVNEGSRFNEGGRFYEDLPKGEKRDRNYYNDMKDREGRLDDNHPFSPKQREFDRNRALPINPFRKLSTKFYEKGKGTAPFVTVVPEKIAQEYTRNLDKKQNRSN